MDDIRLSEAVEKIQENNKEYIEEKSRRLANGIKEYLNKHFDNKYDETYSFVLFMRKGNDVNTLVVNTLLGTGISTGSDRAIFRDSLHDIADSIDL